MNIEATRPPLRWRIGGYWPPAFKAPDEPLTANETARQRMYMNPAERGDLVPPPVVPRVEDYVPAGFGASPGVLGLLLPGAGVTQSAAPGPARPGPGPCPGCGGQMIDGMVGVRVECLGQYRTTMQLAKFCMACGHRGLVREVIDLQPAQERV